MNRLNNQQGLFRNQIPVQKSSSSKWLVIFVVILLVVGAGVGGYFIWRRFRKNQNQQVSPAPDTSPEPAPVPTPSPPPAPVVPQPPSPPATPTSCVPSDGVWSVPDPVQGSILQSPCCQPPDYQVYDSSYETCDTLNSETDPEIRTCLMKCCQQCDNDIQADNNQASKSGRNFLNPTYGKMCKCACSLCCYNQKVPHFSKYGDCRSYADSDLAVARSDDGRIANTDRDWRGWIGFDKDQLMRADLQTYN